MHSKHLQILDSKSIHSFDHPPLIESVLGVQFKQLPKLTNPTLAIFWSTLRHEWPNVSEVSPIELQYERFGDERSWSPLSSSNLLLTQDPATRLRITNPQLNRMIQVQN